MNCVGEDVALSTRAGNLVVSLTHTCAEELVASTMLDGLLSTVTSLRINSLGRNFFI